jgi:hypothetical protein
MGESAFITRRQYLLRDANALLSAVYSLETPIPQLTKSNWRRSRVIQIKTNNHDWQQTRSDDHEVEQ